MKPYLQYPKQNIANLPIYIKFTKIKQNFITIQQFYYYFTKQYIIKTLYFLFYFFCVLILFFIKERMKPNEIIQLNSAKARLPYVSKKPIQFGQSRNHSLKKIVLNNSQNQSSSISNVGLFPKLIQKAKQIDFQNKKTTDIYPNQNQNKFYLPNHNLKKRQKLHTQGQTSQSMTQIQQSFISLTNKLIQNDQQDVKDTMIDFRKKIQQNKLIIKKQIEKKNKQNNSSVKKEINFIKKKRVNSSKVLQKTPEYLEKQSKKTIETPTTKITHNKLLNKEKSETKHKRQYEDNKSARKRQQHHEKRRRQKTEIQHNTEHQFEKSLQKRQSEGLFNQLQVILDDKIKPEYEKHRQQQKKLKSLLEKLHKVKQQKLYLSSSNYEEAQSQSLGNIVSCENFLVLDTQTSEGWKNQNNASRTKLKRQTNYHQWNKLDISSTSQISYRKSSFQEQMRKVQQYTDRNDASLQKYLGVRKQLLKLGFQFCAANGANGAGNSSIINNKKNKPNANFNK